MKNNNKTVLVFLVVIIAISLITYFLYNKNKAIVPVPAPVVNVPTAPIVTATIYSNKDYGFDFTLPDTWKGYSVVQNTWKGNPLNARTKEETGPKFLIRNPKWTNTLPYEDIPVLVFTSAQWSSYIKENFSVSSAPFLASELGKNNKYVFVLPPRWNFDYSEGYKEAEEIIKSNPLKGFDLQSNASGKLNTDVICEGALSYMSFPDSASANKFVTECKEGKHPEVIKKYMDKMNIPSGAAI